METLQLLIDELKNTAKTEAKQVIAGRNALIKELFSALFDPASAKYSLLLLCTKAGLILRSFTSKFPEDLSGYTVSPILLKSHRDALSTDDSAKEFTLIWAGGEELAAESRRLADSLARLLAIFDTDAEKERYLLSCFDAIDNAICIYDKDASLLYGNKSYLDIMQVSDRDAAIGMNLPDIARQSGIKIQATKNGSSNFKMLDVLKSGNKLLDWEVRVESQTSANKAQLVSNNMYPIKGSDGSVEGIIEISSSHQLNLNKMKKLMGLTAEYTFESIIGKSAAITEAIQQAKDYAENPYNLLIVGESGVGKELFAQSIHNYSSRKQEPFVALNCANFPENLIESELFGYVGGAFTGASKNGQIGKFELADGGTLFLDEIGELPLHFQSKLLRVLETRRITRIGSTAETPVDVRVLAATNRDLEEMADEGLFRKDLYYRLQVLRIEIPPLRQRHEDFLPLADVFFRQAAEVNAQSPKHLDSSAQKLLREYDWPGNVREFRNVVYRSALLAKTDIVTAEVLERAIHAKGRPAQTDITDRPEEMLDRCTANVENARVHLINTALEIAGGNKKQAAELIGVSRRTLYRMLEKYKIQS